MKKTIILALCGLFLLSVGACSTSSNSAQVQREYLLQLQEEGYDIDPQLLSAYALGSESSAPSLSLSPGVELPPTATEQAEESPAPASPSESPQASPEVLSLGSPTDYNEAEAKAAFDLYAPSEFLLSNTAFGMTPEVIQYSSGLPFLAYKNNYSYKAKLLEQEGILNYHFDDDSNGLDQIIFSIEQNKNAALFESLETIVSQLNAQYGSPAVSVLHRTWPLSQEERQSLLPNATLSQRSKAQQADYLSQHNLPTLYWVQGMVEPQDGSLLSSGQSEALTVELLDQSASASNAEETASPSSSADAGLSLSPETSPSPIFQSSAPSTSPLPTEEASPSDIGTPESSPGSDILDGGSASPSDTPLVEESASPSDSTLISLLKSNQDGLGEEMTSLLEKGVRLSYLWSTAQADIVLEVQINSEVSGSNYFVISWFPNGDTVQSNLSPLMNHFKKDFVQNTSLSPEVLNLLNGSSLQLTSAAMNQAYDQNALAAELLYENQAIVVRGQIASIYRDEDGIPVIRFQQESADGTLLPPVIARFTTDPQTLEQLINLKKGNIVNIAGICKGEEDGQIILDPCVLRQN